MSIVFLRVVRWRAATPAMAGTALLAGTSVEDGDACANDRISQLRRAAVWMFATGGTGARPAR
jgi:hypothetical protein